MILSSQSPIIISCLPRYSSILPFPSLIPSSPSIISYHYYLLPSSLILTLLPSQTKSVFLCWSHIRVFRCCTVWSSRLWNHCCGCKWEPEDRLLHCFSRSSINCDFCGSHWQSWCLVVPFLWQREQLRQMCRHSCPSMYNDYHQMSHAACNIVANSHVCLGDVTAHHSYVNCMTVMLTSHWYTQYDDCHTTVLSPMQGVDILTTDKEGGYQMYTGTSISAPFVSGALAVHISGQHSADPDNLKDWLLTRYVLWNRSHSVASHSNSLHTCHTPTHFYWLEWNVLMKLNALWNHYFILYQLLDGHVAFMWPLACNHTWHDVNWPQNNQVYFPNVWKQRSRTLVVASSLFVGMMLSNHWRDCTIMLQLWLSITIRCVVSWYNSS